MPKARSATALDSYSKIYTQRRRVIAVAFDRRAFGSRSFDPIRNAAAAAVAGLAFDLLESRQMMAAHVLGSSVNYSTIQAAVNAAPLGGTVTVDAGNYAEMITVGKPLTILGAQAGVDARTRSASESVVTGASGASGVSTIFYITANDVTINGFTIQGNTSATNMGAGIVMAPSIQGTHILDNIIQNNFSGLFLSNNSNTDACIIQGNKFNNDAGGGSYDGVGNKEIYSDGSYAGPVLTNVWIDNNSFYAPNDHLQGAIDLHSASATPQSNITISNNTFSSIGKLLLINCTNVTLLHNTVTNQTDTGSAAVRFEGHNNNIDAQFNSIYSNGGVAMAVDDKGFGGDNSGLTLMNNNIYQDGAGLYLDASNYVGTANITNNWWGSASGPSHDGTGSGLAVGNAVFNQNPSIWTWQWQTGSAPAVFAPWATALLNLSSVPAPASPTSLSASPLSSTSAQLSWTAPASTATSQTLQRSSDGGQTWSTIATLPPLLNSYADTGLITGTIYSYRVSASNSTGSTAFSAAASVTAPAYQPPVAPASIMVTGTTATTASLSWAVPSFTRELTGYVVYRNGTAVATVPAGTTAYTDTGLSASTVYQYAVASQDNTNAVSAPTAAVTASTAGLPVFVFNDGSFEATRVGGYIYNPSTSNWTFTGKSGIEANGSAWNAANAPDGTQAAFLQGYSGTGGAVSQTFTVNAAGAFTFTFSLASRTGSGAQPILVQVDGQTLGTYTPASTSFKAFTTGSINLAAGNHTLSFSTTANSGADSSSFLDAVSIGYQTTVVPSAPSGLTAAAVSASQVTLSWTAVGLPAGYTLQRSMNGGTSWTTVTTTIAASATSYTDSGLSASTAYIYRLIATNAVGSSVPSASASVTTLSASLIKTALSAVPWVSATAGYKTPQLNTSIVGNPLTLRGTVYTSGIGTHAASTIVYNLNAQYTAFTATVGIDDEVITTGGAAVDFQVVGDGRVLFDSGVLTRASAAAAVNISVAGVKTLTLIATNGVTNSIDYDHADWAGATLLTNPATPIAPAVPSNLTAAAVGSTVVALNWTAGDNSQTGFKLDRSADNGNTWTTIAQPTTTSYSDTGLTAGASYVYRVRATNAVGDSANSAAATATLPTAVTSVPLSTLKPTSATAGYGSVQTNASIKGGTITLAGNAYTTGLGTHAPSTITYNLNGAYTGFTSTVGLDDEVAGHVADPVTFQVIGDGQVLYTSPTITAAGQVYTINVSVAGVKTLQLVVTSVNPGNIDFDHADWAGATVIGTLATPVAPAGLTVTPKAGLNMQLGWTASAGATSYTVQRSTDGTTFTTVATGVTTTSYTDTTVISASTLFYYRIAAVNAAGASSPSAIASGTSGQLMSVTYVSDLTPSSATTGYGSVMADKSVSGNALTLAGKTYAKGIGVHAVSQLTYNIGGKYSTFTSDVGVDQEEDGKGIGTVDFQVFGDGKLLYDSGNLTNDQVAHINISVAGVQQLQLVANNGVANSIDYDHADWAGAQLVV